MTISEIIEKLENFPIISAVQDGLFDQSVLSPSEIVFLLDSDVMTVGQKITIAHQNGKAIFVHIDLMRGIGKDKCGVEFLSQLGVDGIISTKPSLIKNAKELGIIAIQRCFALDSQGLDSIDEMISSVRPDFIEIMPGVIAKAIKRFAVKKIPTIAGGLIETKSEVTAALSAGAIAVSTGKKELWYI